MASDAVKRNAMADPTLERLTPETRMAMNLLQNAAGGAARWAAGMPKEIYNAMVRSVDTGGADTGDVATALIPLGGGFLRAAGGMAAGELGATGARILARTDAQKLIREMAQAGKTNKEIAASLNERFAPLLDEGARVTPETAGRTRRQIGEPDQGLQRFVDKTRSGKGDEFELGAMGGRGKEPPGYISDSDVEAIVRELGLAAERRVASSGTSYIDVGERGAAADKRVRVRVPPAHDPHGGQARPWEIDTSIEGTRNPRLGQLNLAGEPYQGNPAAVRERLEYALGKQKPKPETAAPSKETTDPRQLKLLSSGAPLPVNAMAGDPGRFASRGFGETRGVSEYAKPVPPDNAMVDQTRDLSTQVANAAAGIENEMRAPVSDRSEHAKSIPATPGWKFTPPPPGFVLDNQTPDLAFNEGDARRNALLYDDAKLERMSQMLSAIDALGTYTPRGRESVNVEDRRGEIPGFWEQTRRMLTE